MNKTRSGRQIKKPNYYEPDDTELIDDFKQDDYDSDIGSDIETDEECHSEDDENDLCESADDEDINGNLVDFVVDDEDSEEEYA
jgi:hypothetical protein|tara:strand:+ start:3436 stop:3687 length:252 start_codon:yes stop_codon:yes gene_type:complete